jgi:hypothetical protein
MEILPCGSSLIGPRYVVTSNGGLRHGGSELKETRNGEGDMGVLPKN